MGEYANHPTSGLRIKLGTCEDLMYVTRADVEALHAAGWTGDGCALTDYLDEKAFRFALPRDYDVPGDVDTITKREPFYPHRYRIDIDAATAEMLRNVDHGKMYHSAGGTNFFIPCPLGKGPHTLQNSGLHPHIFLMAEGAKNGRAVYECPYCKSHFNLAGHAAQNSVHCQFAGRWMVGGAGLREDVSARLLAMIDWAPAEPVPA